MLIIAEGKVESKVPFLPSDPTCGVIDPCETPQDAWGDFSGFKLYNFDMTYLYVSWGGTNESRFF